MAVDSNLLAEAKLDLSIPPYPYWGGKSRVAKLVWERFGDVGIFIDPFCGGNSILLRRPDWDWERLCWRSAKQRVEIINDKHCWIPNFWRAITYAPEIVAHYADLPTFEADLHARHIYLLKNEYSLTRKVMGDPEYFDPKLAGYWVWGMAVSLGGVFCHRTGPWTSRLGLLVRGRSGHGAPLTRPHLSSRLGIQKGSVSPDRDRIDLLLSWFEALSKRMVEVRVCCHDWKGIIGAYQMTSTPGPIGIFLDPPYSISKTNRDELIYTSDKATPEISDEVREWALEYGDNPDLKIALCGYEGEHEMPSNWEKVAWSTQGGFANFGTSRKENRYLERIWFSPHCLKPNEEKQMMLF